MKYLLSSHIAAQGTDCFLPVFLGASLFFARPDALKGTLNQTLKDVRPTIFFGVPRVWEKIEEKLNDIINESSQTKQCVFKWATKNGFEYTSAKFENKKKTQLCCLLAEKVVLEKVRAQLGLDQAKLLYTGAAPTNKKTLEFIISIGLPLCEVFGLSESTGDSKLVFNKK